MRQGDAADLELVLAPEQQLRVPSHRLEEALPYSVVATFAIPPVVALATSTARV